MQPIHRLFRTSSSTLCVALIALAAQARGADFNGDGYDDLAVGARGQTVLGFQEAGAVHVLYGGPSCLATVVNQMITEASFGTLAAPNPFDLFGLSITSGDFDADGYDDLAVSATGERVSELNAAGAVFVTYGSAGGLDLGRAQMFTQDTKGIADKAEAGEFMFPDLSAETFGRAIVAGDFDGDGFDELAISVGESLGTKKKPKPFAGAVHVLHGSATGLVVKKDQFLHQDAKGCPGKAKAYGSFGWTMVVADFDHDTIDDLAIGAHELAGGGTVTILRGSAGKGLTYKKAVVIDEIDAGAATAGAHHFGRSLAVGDFDGSGGVQLAIGAPLLTVDGVELAGGVYVVSLDPATLAVDSSLFFTRATPGIGGAPVSGAQFGDDLAAGDFDSDGRDELAIGAPRDAIGAVLETGSVTVLHGATTGLAVTGIVFAQGVIGAGGLPDASEYGDSLGATLIAGDFDDDGDDDLVIGVDGDTFVSIPLAGALIVVEGSNSALLDTTQCHRIDQGTPGVGGGPGSNFRFGSALGP